MGGGTGPAQSCARHKHSRTFDSAPSGECLSQLNHFCYKALALRQLIDSTVDERPKRWAQGHRSRKIVFGINPSALLKPDQAAVHISLGTLRIDLNRLVEVIDGAIDVPLRRFDDATVVVRHGVLWGSA